MLASSNDGPMGHFAASARGRVRSKSSRTLLAGEQARQPWLQSSCESMRGSHRMCVDV